MPPAGIFLESNGLGLGAGFYGLAQGGDLCAGHGEVPHEGDGPEF